MQKRSVFVYDVRVSRRRQKRRSQKARRHAVVNSAATPVEVLREAFRVERLVYTRTQAAAALGVSRSTFDRRVLPLIETVEMPWGTRLIPVDELERLIAERRRPAGEERRGLQARGRPAAVAPEVVERIRRERTEGKSLAEIARRLTGDRVPTAHGGQRWWPSTVRSILLRRP